MIDESFWQGRRVYLTGHTGFKGSWLSIWLHQLGAVVKGYALNPPTNPSLFNEAKVSEIVESEIGDIRNFENIRKSIHAFQPEIVIHMAAQPLVRYSYDEPVETYEVNVLGTVHVLEAAKSCPSVRAVINVTTDKCYENKEWFWAYRESEPMGGHDPYSSSKGCSELITTSYYRSFYKQQGVGLASVRAGNVIGGGDWVADRLIPDILKAFEKGERVVIRSPHSIRPWQHVLEPLSGYLRLAQLLFVHPSNFSEGWNFGPNESDERPVGWILDIMIEMWPEAKWELDECVDHPHEAKYLKLDISKAKARLDWSPTWELDQTLERIVDWHQSWVSGRDARLITINEIKEFMRL